MKYDHNAALTVDELVAELQRISDLGHGDELVLINNDEAIDSVCWVERCPYTPDTPAGALLYVGAQSWQ